MDEETRDNTYGDFREAVDDYAGHKDQPDLLTDPAAEAAAKEKHERESGEAHGSNLRRAREQKGFSLDELAEKIGIDAGTLGEVEAGNTILPLGQVIKLGKALSLKMEEVISKGKETFTIVRADQRPATKRFGKAKMESHGYEYESLAPGKKDRKMEPFMVTLHPASSDEPSAHDGQEFIYVMEGEMEVLVEDTRDVLRAGDSIYYDSTSLHLVKAHGDKPAKILAVLVE